MTHRGPFQPLLFRDSVIWNSPLCFGASSCPSLIPFVQVQMTVQDNLVNAYSIPCEETCETFSLVIQITALYFHWSVVGDPSFEVSL